ncbi:protocadherin Fat 4-like isoform X2 [Rhopilema esculentum]|uniref:protocadherin Fat 4-like isoform X2 n=1 Tax=Rhopilema esculentum TaxID=499914 RepID=UPI0031D24F1E
MKRYIDSLNLLTASVLLLFFAALPYNIHGLNYRPHFTRNQLINSIIENTPAGTSVSKLSDFAVDDEGDVIKYSLDTVGQSYCNIDSASGLITLAKPLDREVNERVSFTAYAEDNFEGGGAARRASIMVFIYVLDLNEWAPEFQGTPYHTAIPENATGGYSVITVRATDKDDGSNSEISFEFKAGSQISQFSLDANSGVIKVSGPLDYEVSTRYTLSVVAKDKGDTPLSSEARVIVDVIDVSDNTPIFSPSSSYEARVDENLPTNSKITKVTASDGDKGVNNAINYEIYSGNVDGLFTVDRVSGDIRANGALDREKTSAYQLKIKAYEVPMPSSFSLAGVLIQLNDVNDFKPVFTNRSFTFTIDEDKPKGFIIGQLIATDGDATSTNSVFQYSLGGDSSRFAVNSLSGQLTVNSVLDYESQSTIIFTVFATETLSSERFSGNATVTVHLNNMNDNSPIFNQSTYDFKVFENAPAGTVLGFVKASDFDKGSFGELSYTLSLSSQTSSLFQINSTSGKITLKSQPDYEVSQFHVFPVIATDGGGSNAKTTSATVRINVLDINDNYPEFDNLPTTISVPENQAAASIFTVKASDKDSGLNGQVRLKLINQSAPEFFFNEATGVLNTTEPLDFESARNRFVLLFNASDHGVSQKSVTQRLEIAVQDENDHTPTFEHSVYNATINENARIGSLVIDLNATDLDSALNGKVTYQILSGNERNTFSLSATTGEIRTQDILDRETVDEYQLLIRASDHGSPSLLSTVLVKIKVEDFNDNYPNFLQTSYSAKVNESAPVGFVLLSVKASDADAGDNGRVAYFITAGNDQGKFRLENSSGDLLIEKHLDWEKTSTYILNIRAEDHGIVKKSRNVFVSIDVIDSNDNPPIFTVSHYSFQIYENTPVARSVGRVTAVDADGKLAPNRNGVVMYSIIAGNVKGHFKIDENIGTITTNGSIDREKTAYYNLTVAATDGGFPQNSANVDVVISIIDVNDNVPSFTRRNYTVEVAENVTIGSIIARVRAIDSDAGINAQLSYAITSGNDEGAFSVRPTGDLIVTRQVDRETKEKYTLKISVSDSGTPQLANQTDVFITILDTNDNRPVFLGTPYMATVLEEQPAGTRVLQVAASDADFGRNAFVTYKIEQSVPLNVFQINKTSGIVTTVTRIDRELQATYILNISAMDDGKEHLTTFASVTVSIGDINDNYPVLGNLPNRTNVSEGVPVGRSVFDLHVRDIDSGDNAKLAYTIISGAFGKFHINDGIVLVKAPLNREERNAYFLAINISDSGNPPLSVSSSLQITITDVNDNAPMFIPNPVLNPALYVKTIPEEEASLNLVIFDINATDADIGKNGEVIYSIIGGNERGHFAIDPETGKIKVAKAIDREDPAINRNLGGLGTFSLTVRAADQAEANPRFVTTSVDILVSDINDNEPVFGSQRYFAGTSEGAAVSSTVITVSASDRDLGLNSRITYTIVNGNTNGDFAISNPYAGVISVAKPLNAEQTSTYNLTVMAKDDGSLNHGKSFNSTVIVQIKIGDLNDNDPVFNQSEYKAFLKENIAGKHHVISVLATDADQGTNGEVWYQITSGNTDETFQINNRTGEVFSVKPVDRERNPKFTLTIKGEDRGTPSTRKSAVELVINVQDVNDNPPKFKSSVYVGKISENSPPGTRVSLDHLIEFEDPDQIPTPISLSLADAGFEKFTVNSTSKTITTAWNSSFDREDTPILYLKLVARDSDGLSSESTLIIVIDDVNDNRPVFNESYSIVNVSENAAIGFQLLTLQAHDRDHGLNARLSYTIRGGDDTFIFNQSTESVQLNKKLDREVRGVYQLEVIAVDQGKPSLDGKAVIIINVIDVVDSPPYFHPDVVTLNLNEAHPTNSVIYTLQAKDSDLYDNITYNATSPLLDLIHLDSLTGKITLVKNLDRENRTNYQFTFQAFDSMSLQSPPNGLTLKINVLDVNDNAPRFLQPFYTNDVVENTPDGTIVMSVLATDDDENLNAKVTYSILENLSSLLRIDPDKGFISKYGVWKTTPGGWLNFTVVARDSGSPPLSSSVRCVIRWVAVNALNPRFNKSLYEVTLKENAAIGTEVIRLIAYKRGEVEAVTFTMTGGHGCFLIEQNTGVIRVAKVLDREQQDRFAVTVTATDNQSSPQNGVTSVTITLEDVNDNNPIFTSAVYRFSVSEKNGPGFTVGSVVASDQDAGNNSRLTYSFSSGNERNWFAINSSNGTIRSVKELDREIQEEFKLTVTARDHGLNSLNATVSVWITILDVNDNTPMFSRSLYNITVNEDLPGDSQVVLVSASDRDKGVNGSVLYSIEFGNDLGHFYIGRTTGIIRIAKLLDHESVHDFNLTVFATDNGSPAALSSASFVLIKVLDVNDNKPRFQSPTYSFSVKENAAVGHRIGQVSAVDVDASYNEVFYAIQEGSTQSVVRISQTNGSIFLAKTVDREVSSKYVLQVEAYNKDIHGNASLKSFAEVTLNIIDINDNAPRFLSPNCCNVSLFENANVGDVILRIAAADADAGSNSEISYAIVKGDDNGEFKIDSSTGDLKLMKSLDHERAGHYSLVVNAKDHGIPMLSTNSTVRVSVLDVNDMAPVFMPLNVTSISEDVAVGTLILKVTAIDKDTEANGEVFYEIISGNEENSFALASSSGEVTVARKLDYERAQSYKLRVMARDRGTPFLSSFTVVTINITNVNDNVPTFLQSTLYASVGENLSPGTNIARISASDADKDAVFYYIEGSHEDTFALDENTGVLRTKKSLDRETTQVYTLTIVATNTKRSTNLIRTKRASPKGSFSTQQVIIEVDDQNDNAPKFTQKEYRAGVSENAKYATSILQVAAIDLDAGNNSNIAYSMIGGQNEGFFVLEKKTGWIKSAQLFTGKVGRNFELKVVAEDNDGRSPNRNDTAIVKIFVLTDNQRVVLTMNVDPQTVRDNKEEFIRFLQNITSFKINIDDIQYSTKNGEYDRTSTDLVFHAIDRTTNEIQDRDVVIQAIARNQEKFQWFFQKWKVQSVKAVVVPTSVPTHDETQTILIAVAAALFLIILGFVFALCYLRRKQQRKLKAATASAKDSDATLELEHMHKLNTMVKGAVSGKKVDNSHVSKSLSRASERFYPMWVEPKDENFDSISSSASYYEENKSMNTVSNTRTLTTEIIMMQDPYNGETDVDYYPDGYDFYGSEDISDMYDSQTDDDTIDREFGATFNPVAGQVPTKEELLLRASLQPIITFENGVITTATSI